MKQSHFYAIILLLLSLNGFCQMEKLTKKGDAAFEQKSYFEALKLYEQALGQNQQDAYLNWRIAQCYLITSPKTKALSYANAVKNSPKPTPEMYGTLAQALHINQQFDQAIEYYKKSDPSNKNKRYISKLIGECNNGKYYMGNPQDYKITNAGAQVNSEYPDYLPYITADRSKLFFTSRRPGSTGGKKEYDGMVFEDIYISNNKGGAWDVPYNPGAPLNSDVHDACIGLADDGQMMFVYKSVNGGDVYTSELKGKRWTNPEPLTINSEFFETCVTISSDERTLLFVRKVMDGSRDIYSCSRTTGGAWSKPKKVDNINTEWDEDAPFLHPDGKTLYFSSKGHSTMGGYDIFKSERTATGWGVPKNMGYPLNTAGDDVYFILSADGKVGFYSSDKEGGYGKTDIYSIRMPADEKQPELALLKGVIKDATGKPVEADITITDNTTKETVAKLHSNEATGEYLLALPAGKNYGIAIEKQGHLFYSENVYTLSATGYKEIVKDIKLSTTGKGSKTALNNLFFDSGKAELKPESATELERLAKFLAENSTIKIEISGHTDNIGNQDANKALSEKRAQQVVNYLMAKGISKDRLSAKGYGSSQPLASNDTPDGRQQNRRTEIRVL